MRRPPFSNPRPRPYHFGQLALAALAATMAGCSDDDSDDCDQCGPPPPPVYVELEPNDSPLMPDRIGVVDAFTLLYVDGHVEVVPGVDIVDHIEFLAASPAVFDFRIDALSAYGDIDVTVYDPVADVVVGVFAVSGSVEYGRVVVHQHNRPFQLIIEAYQYDTFWSLELVGDFYSGFLTSTSGPRDAHFSRQDTPSDSAPFATSTDDSAGSRAGEGAHEPERVSPIEAYFIRADERI
jgi:hypothetical protein